MSVDLEAEFEQASSKIHRLAAEGMGLVSTRRGAEARYGVTYQALVRAGLRRQIRGKYRGV